MARRTCFCFTLSLNTNIFLVLIRDIVAVFHSEWTSFSIPIWNENSIHVLFVLRFYIQFGAFHSLWQCTLWAMKKLWWQQQCCHQQIKQYVNVFGLFILNSSFFIHFILGNYSNNEKWKIDEAWARSHSFAHETSK